MSWKIVCPNNEGDEWPPNLKSNVSSLHTLSKWVSRSNTPYSKLHWKWSKYIVDIYMYTWLVISVVITLNWTFRDLSFPLFRVRVMMFDSTFNNISVMSWRSVLLVEETRVPVENHRQTWSHNVVSDKLKAWMYVIITVHIINEIQLLLQIM